MTMIIFICFQLPPIPKNLRPYNFYWIPENKILVQFFVCCQIFIETKLFASSLLCCSVFTVVLVVSIGVYQSVFMSCRHLCVIK